MTSTPTNRLKLTPSNSPFLPRPGRSPLRARAPSESRLSLKRVVGTTCSSPTGFDTVSSTFAYIAGGAVVVVDVDGELYTQRFFRAHPTAVPLFAVSPASHNPSTPNSTPKANDSRNRISVAPRDSPFTPHDWSESPSSSKTWTSRERIKAATCLALSPDGKFLAVGETGYAPRVLIFSLQDSSSDIPIVSISEHAFGVNAVAWSHDCRYLASLGTANDGFLYLWKVDPRTGSTRLFQQSRCVSNVKGMMWVGNSLVTLGTRHVKVWRVDETQAISPAKQKFARDYELTPQSQQKTLPGRNILLGNLLDATFSCAAPIDESRLIVCTETGDVCILDDTDKQMKLNRMLNVGFGIACIAVRGQAAYIGGKAGQYSKLDLPGLLDGKADSVVEASKSPTALVAMGFLADNLVTIDVKRSIDVWEPDHIPGRPNAKTSRIPITGHGDPIMGIQLLPRPNVQNAMFYTWSASGRVSLWDLGGKKTSFFDIPVEQVDSGGEGDPFNQLTVLRATSGGKLFISGDKLGVFRVIDFATNDCLLETKAHSFDCQDISLYETETKLLMASCGRDRTAQLFHRLSDGTFEHFQTLEFPFKVAQVLIPSEDKVITCCLDRTLKVHDLVAKDGDVDVVAAIPSRTISLKASPTSIVMAPDEKSIFVSLMNQSVCQYDMRSGRQLSSFRCTDESGAEAVILDSLIFGPSLAAEPTFLLGVSNTDKSVRLYDLQAGSFLDREWGHTEAINGVILVDDEDGTRKVVSAGSDGTIMVWTLNMQDALTGSLTRDPSPVKESNLTSNRPPLRKVLSKAELAEFQRPVSTTPSGRRSPPRIQRRPSKFNLNSAMRTPTANVQISPASTVAEDTPSRRSSKSGSPPVSPKDKSVSRRPSLPALGTSIKTPSSGSLSSRKKSMGNMRNNSIGFGTLNMATEQACRTLRTYRKKLSGSDPITPDALAELDQELRLTAAALGDRAVRSKGVSESVLNGLLDQYSERLVSMLDEKLRLRDERERRKASTDDETGASEHEEDDSDRPRTAGAESYESGSGSGSGSGSVSDTVVESLARGA